MHRRQFISGIGAAALAWPRLAAAFGRSNHLTFALLDGGAPEARHGAWKRLALEVEQRTSITCEPKPLIIDSGGPELFDYPLVFCIGSGEAPNFSAARWGRLAQYLRGGGMIYFDGLSADDPFGNLCLERLAAHLPSGALQKTPKDHVLYRSFYLLEAPVGRFAPGRQPAVAEVDGRLVAIAGGVDVGGALMRDHFGAWAYRCDPGGEAQREQAMRFAINLVMYALCTDYKADQVHIPFLLKRRR
jgi:hypothetical protein